MQDRLKQQQESLVDLELLQSSSGPAHPVKVEKVKYLTREECIQYTCDQFQQMKIGT